MLATSRSHGARLRNTKKASFQTQEPCKRAVCPFCEAVNFLNTIFACSPGTCSPVITLSKSKAKEQAKTRFILGEGIKFWTFKGESRSHGPSSMDGLSSMLLIPLSFPFETQRNRSEIRERHAHQQACVAVGVSIHGRSCIQRGGLEKAKPSAPKNTYWPKRGHLTSGVVQAQQDASIM